MRGLTFLVAGFLMLVTTTGASDDTAQAADIESDCLGHLRSAIARGALEGRSRRDEQTGEPYDLPAKFGGQFNPGDFKGPSGVDDFLAYIGIDDFYLEHRGCVLPIASLSLIGDCVDFDASDECSPRDDDGDGYLNFIERRTESNPNDILSTPEFATLDDQQGASFCDDKVDNDRDGRVDRSDGGCRVRCDDFGLTDGCSDSDRDGWLNYVEERYESDPGSAASTPEAYGAHGSCSDEIDNDLDGRTDESDFFCPDGPF
jgi:hypothetical protein